MKNNIINLATSATVLVALVAFGVSFAYASEVTGNLSAGSGGATTTTSGTTTGSISGSVETPSTPSSNGGGGGGGGGGGSYTPPATTTATTTPWQCGPLLNQYLHIGRANNPIQMMLLKIFLNWELGIHLDATDTLFDLETFSAVEEFQAKYRTEVLLPWVPFGHNDKPSGWVYKTTQWKINSIFCPTLNVPFPRLP